MGRGPGVMSSASEMPTLGRMLSGEDGLAALRVYRDEPEGGPEYRKFVPPEVLARIAASGQGLVAEGDGPVLLSRMTEDEFNHSSCPASGDASAPASASP